MIIPNGYGHVNHFFTGTGVPLGAAVTYGIANVALDTPDDAAQVLHDIVKNRILPNLTNTVTLSTTRVKMGPNATGPFADYTDPTNGGSASGGTSPNVTYLMEKRSGIGGRQGQGRCYWPGVAESSVGVDGVITLTVVDALNIDFNDMLQDMIAAGFPMYLLHNNSLAPTQVTSLVCDAKAATQRRRMRR